MKKIVLFASGSGSNAENIIKHFNKKSLGTVVAVCTNNPNAKVLDKAKNFNIPTLVFDKNQLSDGFVLNEIKKLGPDLIVLAGFLLLFPKSIVAEYPNKIINIHPSLLPKYGGKGMYGKYVHQAVFENKETETGITIHYVNEKYDEGDYIFQKAIPIENCRSADDIAAKVLELEHLYFPEVIEEILNLKS